MNWFFNLYPLLLTLSSRSNMDPELVNKVCSGIRQHAEKVDPIKYVNTILTSFVIQSPPDYEEALSHLHRLRGSSTLYCLDYSNDL